MFDTFFHSNKKNKTAKKSYLSVSRIKEGISVAITRHFHVHSFVVFKTETKNTSVFHVKMR